MDNSQKVTYCYIIVSFEAFTVLAFKAGSGILLSCKQDDH